MSGARLPRAYSAFAPVFAQMDPALSEVLNGILSALSSRADAAALHEQHPSGEFIGYDGIEHRGKLSNLLETEWLLRELDPDDFVRRVAEGEVLYRRRDFADPGKRNTLAVIVDCGPWMLGRNRLIALAALFYLALRAERLGSDLHWIIPGGEKGAIWTEGLTRDTIRQYLGQIVQGDIRANGIDRVLDELNPEGRLDCWYVGARETASITEHPAIDASFLVNTLVDTEVPSAEIEVSAGRGRLTRVAVAFPNDDTCIAALRRPFKPEVTLLSTAPTKPGDSGDLVNSPYPVHWLLDRTHKAVLIRYPEGLFWQPLTATQQYKSVWIPMGQPDAQLFGVAFDGRYGMTVVFGADFDRNGCGITGGTIGLSASDESNTVSEIVWGQVSFPRWKDPFGLPVMEVEKGTHADELVLTLVDGHVHGVGVHPDHGQSHEEVTNRPRSLYLDANYRITMTDADPPELVVWSLNRKSVMMTVPLPEWLEGVENLLRKVLFTPTSKLIAITTDGTRYTVLGTDNESEFSMPDGWELLHLNTRRKGIAWNREEGALVRFSFLGSEMQRSDIVERIGPGLSHVRYCPLTSTAFGIEFDDSGAPKRFVPILTKRDWSNVESIDLTDAVLNARTVRISE